MVTKKKQQKKLLDECYPIIFFKDYLSILVNNPTESTVASASPLSWSSSTSHHYAHTHIVSTLHIDQYSPIRKHNYKSMKA